MPDALELLWVDTTRVDRARNDRDFRATLAGAEAHEWRAPSLPGQAASRDDRRDALTLLTRARETDGPAVARALGACIEHDGRYSAPLFVVAGELALAFDEIATLRMTLATALPFAAGDAALEALLDAGSEFLSLADALPVPAAAEELTLRIGDAFGRATRGVPGGYLESETRRGLLERRAYALRHAEGIVSLRTLLYERDAKAALLVHLPAAAAESLPLAERFHARLLVEAHPSSDPSEPHAFALRAGALGRVVSSLA